MNSETTYTELVNAAVDNTLEWYSAVTRRGDRERDIERYKGPAEEVRLSLFLHKFPSRSY
jgi:hypothetical protein